MTSRKERFEYDVAISFAGDQRAEAEAICPSPKLHPPSKVPRLVAFIVHQSNKLLEMKSRIECEHGQASGADTLIPKSSGSNFRFTQLVRSGDANRRVSETQPLVRVHLRQFATPVFVSPSPSAFGLRDNSEHTR